MQGRRRHPRVERFHGHRRAARGFSETSRSGKKEEAAAAGRVGFLTEPRRLARFFGRGDGLGCGCTRLRGRPGISRKPRWPSRRPHARRTPLRKDPTRGAVRGLPDRRREVLRREARVERTLVARFMVAVAPVSGPVAVASGGGGASCVIATSAVVWGTGKGSAAAGESARAAGARSSSASTCARSCCESNGFETIASAPMRSARSRSNGSNVPESRITGNPRRRRVRLDRLAHLVAVLLGHHGVGEDQVGHRYSRDPVERLLPVRDADQSS